MKIIGHRGAAGLAPENTLKAIKAGVQAGADAIEFDVRQTKDNTFVLCHDPDLQRIANTSLHIKDATLADLYKIDFLDGELIPTLQDALDVLGKATAIIEAKGAEWAETLAQELELHNDYEKVCVIAFDHAGLAAFHHLLPSVRCYALERHNPFATMRFAKQTGLHGVNLNYWLLNPFTYLYARILKLNLIIYTVDKPFLMRYFSTFYPQVAITTNRPDILKKIRK